MKISVVMPVLNEIRYTEGWYQNVKKFADEIIVVDTGSIDGTYEHLSTKRDVYVKRWEKSYKPYCWPEHEIRNWMLNNATGHWIVPLDADEMVTDEFIESLNDLSGATWLIGRYVCLQFWKDYLNLRGKNFWPPVRLSKARSSFPIIGKWRLGILRNWRGWYPGKFPRVCRRDNRISYPATGNHCALQYKNFGKLSYHLPGITKDFNIGICHSHFVFFEKIGGNRNDDRNKIVKLVEYKGKLPDEIKYYSL